MSSKETRYDSILTQEQCELLLIEKLATSDFQLLDYCIKPISETRLGYMGEHLRLKCVLLKSNSSIETTENFFIKLKERTDGDNSLAEFAETFDVYLRESSFYQLTKDYQETLNQTRKWCSKFYGFYNKQCIILEDLSEDGYRLTDQQLNFDLTHCQIGLKTFAAFHAFSFKLMQDNSETKSLQELYPSVASDKMFFPIPDTLKKWFKSSFDSLLFLFTIVPAPKRPIDELQQMLKCQIDLFYDKLQAVDYRFKVITHGDVHGKNMLFKYNENNQPVNCCLIDFQGTRCAPISFDVLLFITVNTAVETQNKHMESLKLFYYDQLCKEVKLLTDQNLEEIYSQIEFEIDCRKTLIFSKMAAAINKSVLLSKDSAKYLMMGEFSFGDRIKFFRKFLEENENNYKENIISVIEDLQNCLIEIDY